MATGALFMLAKNGFVGLQDFVFLLSDEQQKQNIINYHLTNSEKEIIKNQIFIFINAGMNYSIISIIYNIILHDLIEYKRNQIINGYYKSRNILLPTI